MQKKEIADGGSSFSFLYVIIFVDFFANF